MAELTYAEQRQKAAQLLIDQKHAGNAMNATALASAGGRPAFSRAMQDFQKSYNADPANKDNQLQDPRNMGKLIGALETTAARKAPAATATAENVAAAPTAAPAAEGPKIDPELQKAQGYMRAFGITEVEIDGQKHDVKVDGINSPATSAALAKYRADNGLDKDGNVATALGHMEERIKQNPPGVQQFMSETMADGQHAGGANISAMQMIINLLAPLIQALSGGKINLDQLKVDGINGQRTTNAYNGYNAVMNNNAYAPPAPEKPQEKTPRADTPPTQQAPQESQAQPDNADPLGAFIAEKDKEAEARLEAAANTPAVEPGRRPALQVDGGIEAGSPSYARSPRGYAGDNGLYKRPAGYSDVRQQYNAASGAEVRDRMLQQRAELRETGYAPRDVKAIVRDARVQELEGSGLGRRAALSQANMETRMVDNVERGFAREDRAYDRAMRQEQAAYNRALRAEDRHITNISRDFGRAAGILTDRNPRNDHRATSILTGAGVEAVLRGGVPGLGVGGARGGYGMERTPGIVADGGVIVSGGRGAYSNRDYDRAVRAEDRDITRISRDFGRAAGILTDNNPRNDHRATNILTGAGVEAVLRGGVPGMGVGGARGGFGVTGVSNNPINALISAIGGGNSRTYAAQPLSRGAYAGYDRGGAQEWNGNQIRPEFDGARSYGNANDPRMALSAVREQQIMAADQPQTMQERAAEQRRMQEMYSPG